MIISFNTSSKICSVAIRYQNKIKELISKEKLSHSVSLMPMIDRLLKENNKKINDIKTIIIANGPGSFTGLRIASATAAGIKSAIDIDIKSVNTLDMMSYSENDNCKIKVSIIDARRGTVYAAIYGKYKMAAFNGEFNIILDYLKDKKGDIVFIGEDIEVFHAKAEKILKRKIRLKESIGAKGLILSYLEGNYSNEYMPNYMRKTQAEREKENVNNTRN